MSLSPIRSLVPAGLFGVSAAVVGTVAGAAVTHSAPGANLLYDRGWMKTYTMVDGFEGSKRRDGDTAGVRDVGGWRNSGLPWSYLWASDMIYRFNE